ncbi:hypothetical protein QMK33_03155 [Hymenobacter sp. H14-R3]|uniref:hypothetical protein n=1 Tax=Hymenobacter sp. H14-R3 TaxID=3046308 RepID=UPI0024BB7A1F|nr:hypothetical protein [Hymenobacter sp. H14-R3]MDJ0364136.1 hypothetical protein [Hymenobacter sp. H14-R3]
MSRSLLVMMLVLNYLLVVCASVGGRPAPPVARAYGYVHSPDCQLQNAWRGGSCFDDCNGVQYHVQKGHKPVPLQQLLTSLKGVDLHCLPAAEGTAGRPFVGRNARPLAWYAAGTPAGVRGRLYDPPRRG